MTIPTTIAASGPYFPNGATTAFPFGFKASSDQDVTVVLISSAGVEEIVSSAGYAVTLAAGDDPGGTVTMAVAPVNDGRELWIYLDPTFLQEIKFEDEGAFNQTILNQLADEAGLRSVWLRERINRAVLAPRAGAALDAAKGKYPTIDATGLIVWSDGTTPDDSLRLDLAARGAGQGGDIVGLRDSALPAGSKFTTLQGMVDKLRDPTYGGDLIPYGSDKVYADGTVANELIPRVTLAILPIVSPKTGKVAFVQDDGKEGFFKCFPGAPPVADLWQGLYVTSTHPAGAFYWARIWDQQNGKPEWFGVKSNDAAAVAANDTKIAACYAMVPHTRFGPFDYWTSATIKANINHHKISGCGEKYNDQFGAMTRIVCNSGAIDIMRVGPDAYPGSIGAMPQGIQVRDIMLGRSVAPVIASGCRGLIMAWCLNAVVEDVKTDGNMIGIEAYGTVHCFEINVEAVRANAGTGGGTDYFVGNYANGGSGLFAGGNASLYVVNCTAGCNYGPLQTATGSVGFKADQGFTDVWYWNPETTNFYNAQMVLGNDATGNVFTNTDFMIDHPIHDQFKNIGLYIADVGTAGSVEVEKPYFGPSTSARACYWVNSSEGAVAMRGGQFVMGGAPAVQAILLTTSRGCDILDFPIVLEHGNTYPVCGLGDVSDARIEVFGKNPNVTAGALVQLSGTCTNVVAIPKASGKASSFQYGIQVVGANDVRCTYDVSNINSACLPAVNRKLDRNGTPITAVGATGTNYATGNFN